MTLKEKVAEVIPECVDEEFIGGVLDCPRDYEFLNTDICLCLEVNSDCTACWNREYKEVPDARD